MAGPDKHSLAFEAVLYPNPPLGRRGFRVVIAVTAAFAAIGGGAFVAIGAWPVTGFLGLDILGFWIAMRWARQRAKLVESSSLDRSGLHVTRTDPKGRSDAWRFDPCWVQVSLPPSRQRQTGVLLASHGRALKLGHFLTRSESEELKRALETALLPYRLGT